MKSRWLRIGMLIYLLAWFGVIAPGHQRGYILVAGASDYVARSEAPSLSKPKSCCPITGKQTGSQPSPLSPRGKSCAVCHIVATTPPPTPADPPLLAGERTGLSVVEIVKSLTGIEWIATHRGRAPPAPVSHFV